MATRIRTLNFLPDIFKTPANTQFLRATLDQVVDQPNLTKIEGYIGSKFGYGINANSHYVIEPTPTRINYQLDPSVVFLKQNTNTAQDFISYPGIIDALKLQGAVTDNNTRLFAGQFYSWDSFVDLDKIINFNQYYWLPSGLPQVTVAVDSVFDTLSYVVVDNSNGYNVASEGSNISATNPTITLLRGGVYTFAVNQNTQFWIQGEAGVTGFGKAQPNMQTRDVLGVQNNGENAGLVTFTVPSKDAQDQYNFPGNNLVDLVTSLPYDMVNGALRSVVGNIDGITALDGRTVMFFNDGVQDEQGYVSNFYDAVLYDTNGSLITGKTVTITGTTAGTNYLTCASTAAMKPNQSITFTGTVFGGVTVYSEIVPNTIYYVRAIIDLNTFTVSLSLSGPEFVLSTATGSMTGNINQGLFEGGYFTEVSATIYMISYVGDYGAEVLKLTPVGTIPTNQKITAINGSQWISRTFYRDPAGSINLIPYLSATLDTLYYQDGSASNKVGKFKIIDSNLSNTLNILEDILGQTQYTAPNGVVFTNGLKVSFTGDIYPSSYENIQFYVEGVGTAIELISVAELIAAEITDSGEYIPFDSVEYDIGNFDSSLYVPIYQDYITVARNSMDRNAWSRSNRWFHVDVINATAKYNQDPTIVSTHTVQTIKAKRPIIEFYPNLRMYNSGVLGKQPIDFIDFRTTDAFSQVEGKPRYFPDVSVTTTYTAGMSPVATIPTSISATLPGSNIQCVSVNGFRVNDKIIFSGTKFGGIEDAYSYYISSINTLSNSITISVAKDGPTFITTVDTGTMTAAIIPLSTVLTLPTASITGAFLVGQYVVDSDNSLPTNTRISAITATPAVTELTVAWDKDNYGSIPGASTLSLIATVGNSDNFSLFDGSRVVFAADTNPAVRNKIYTSRMSRTSETSEPVITLTEASDGQVQADELTFVFRGTNYHSKDFYYNGSNWTPAQQKTRVNQPPLFDILDHNGISFSNQTYYSSSSFAGSTLFEYGPGAGMIDAVLGFPIRYSSVDNVGDISFNVTLNTDTFNFVQGQIPMTQMINTGYVHSYSDLSTYTRHLGWQSAIAPSVQNQIFDFAYIASTGVSSFVCDVAMTAQSLSKWPTIQVYVNNVVLADTQYTVSVTASTTVVNVTMPNTVLDTTLQIVIQSTQTSRTAYFEIPSNLNNNPLNSDVATVNVGDIRRHYQSIFNNAPNTLGYVLSANNYRDSGNLVPYGNAIVQNSASLVLPATFLRKQNHSLFDALLFSNREYIAFKTLLVNTVNLTPYAVYPTAQAMLDAALDQITISKTSDNPFFWSDMLPTKAAYITNKYSFANSLDNSIYPLSRIYDFTKANYFGIVVYLSRLVNDVITVSQLVRGVNYTVSVDSPSLYMLSPMQPGDRIDIREYNQTYGSYVPNTPTKLGLFPATIPEVRLDSNYFQPTYFIVGHDGSYTKLYGEYDPENNVLNDFRDQVLLEFELRVFNNLKINAAIPINEYEVMPGFFRTTEYSSDEVTSIYSTGFLNWIGQNRINYQPQQFSKTNEFSFNYYQSQNKISGLPIEQGNWRGLYQYMYDTSNPDTAPWEMLGFTNKPTWFDSHYGVAPYTSENMVLWNDLAAGINWNNGDPVVIPQFIRPELLSILPVDTAGKIRSPFIALVGNYINQTFNRDWKVGDMGPAELSYRRSSSWPFDLMRIFALAKPAEFFNLAVDLDNYRYNAEFNQFLVNDRSHLVVKDIDIYGTGTAKTSYINWIVDYEKQIGVPATQNIKDLLSNIDVRLSYRVAGFSDKNLLKFYVEKSTATSNNNTLLIPDESYAMLLYDNQPFSKIIYSGVVVQISPSGYKVFGSSQTMAYFATYKPVLNGNYSTVRIEQLTVQVPKTYSAEKVIVPYGTEFTSVQEVGQFLNSYGVYLESQGVLFDQITNGIPINWTQMVAEFLYWAQTGWEVGSIININPAADVLTINKDSNIVQPLTLHQQNFILNQNMYPIASSDMQVIRDGTLFSAQALNKGDSINYGVFNISNFEHAVIFDNTTVFGDRIYNLVTGLRQDRIVLRGTKTAAWDGTVDAQGFILNQDNVQEWSNTAKYTTGSIVTYKNKYWIATSIVQAAEVFDETKWKQTDYNEIQKGLLPNPSTRSYESTLYYNSNKSNLDPDADLLSFSLIGYRPRDYLAVADLTEITQVNVYKNLIKSKGTPIAATAFKGATLSQGGIDYDLYENWAIKTAEFGGILNSNFVEFKLDEKLLTSNPSIVGLTTGKFTLGVQQEVPVYSLFNYGRPVTDPKVLTTIPGSSFDTVLPDAGYVNFNDVKISAYYYNDLSTNSVPLTKLYVWDYLWLADYMGTWQVATPIAFAQLVQVVNNLNGIATFTFTRPHNLVKYQGIAVANFDVAVDGYFSVMSVVDPVTIQVRLNLLPSINTLTGTGTAFSFQSSRVAKPSQIQDPSLLTTEFVKNTMWVDTNTDGDWAVYRKGINYSMGKSLSSTTLGAFGSAVAYSSSLGYLVGDSISGELTRYSFNDLFKEYELTQTITGNQSFGSIIEHAGDTFVVPEPLGTPALIQVFKLVNDTETNELQPFNSGLGGLYGEGGYGTAVAISGDRNWIYATKNEEVWVYRKSAVTGQYKRTTKWAAEIRPPAGAGGFGYSLATDYYGDTLVVGAPLTQYAGVTPMDNWGMTYVYDRTVQEFEAQYSSIPFVPQIFPLAWIPGAYNCTATSTVGPDTVISPVSLISGRNYIIGVVGTTDWQTIGAPASPWTVGQHFTANGVTGSGTGTALAESAIIVPGGIDTTTVELFMPVVFTGVMFGDLSANVVYFVQSLNGTLCTVANTKISQPVELTGGDNSSIFVADTSKYEVGQPIIFYGYAAGCGINSTTDDEHIYYIYQILSSTEFTVKYWSTDTAQEPINAISNPDNFPVNLTAVTLANTVTLTTASGTMTAVVQSTPMTVSINGTVVSEKDYAVTDDSLLNVIGSLTSGDIIEVSSNNFVLAQTLTTEVAPRVGVHFGESVDITNNSAEILVGAPFALNDQNQEGAVFRFTNGGEKYGSIIGTSVCSIVTPLTILLNGYSVTLPAGSAVEAADTINAVQLTNIRAYAATDPLDPTYGLLTIALIDSSLAGVNDKLTLTAMSDGALAALGMVSYTQTQVINDPHNQQTTQFGTKVKFNEFDSFVVSAPTSTRFVATTFDFTDDANNDNDLLFDNNSTRWVDTFKNAGAAYMFDYLANYNESLADIGKFTYAQCVNDITSEYGSQPMFGHAIDFNNNQVVIGTPNFRQGAAYGQVVTFINASGLKDWSVFRSSSPIVDINRLQDIQLFSAGTNMTIDNLDYIDPLAGKLLGSVRENIDVISSQDPAGYTSATDNDVGALVWGADKVGHIWFNTATTKFVNYHQNDVVYDSVHWGTVFPGSDVTVYTWVSSPSSPTEYAGPGTPFDVNAYSTEYALSAADALMPVYFFWVRNTNKVFTQAGKTLADSTIQSYITSPQNSGISYFTPLQSDIYALYNCGENINATDTVLHIGFASGTTDDVPHNLFNLIRSDYADDFVPGLPNTTVSDIPSSLYSKLLDSMCGVDISGAVVPNPYLPKAVQYGISTRPNQSFFIDRYEALKNYLTYANTVLAQYPISEIKQPTFLFGKNPQMYATVDAGNFNIGTSYVVSQTGTTNFTNIGAESNFIGQPFVATGPGTGTGKATTQTFTPGELFDTTKYWDYVTWWAAGYNDNTKAFMQVPLYADLATIKASHGLIVTVETNGNGQSETYIYQDSIWNRIGLQNGTIQFNSALWNYAKIRMGFGDSFFDTTPYSEFPAEETRLIIRALTEEIYTNELLIHRNKSLILLFEFIQSETTAAHNYLPWLNKTSFVDVSHTIRELRPISVFQSDNQQFLAGYLNEVKPYHVVIKEFIFKYTGAEMYSGDITDFDLPAAFSTQQEEFITPVLVYRNPSNSNEFTPDDPIWNTHPYKAWADNHGLSLVGIDNYQMTWLSSYMVLNSSECQVDNAFGFPVSGIIQIDDEQMSYSSVDRALSILHGLSRGANGTAITTHLPGAQLFINLPPVMLLNGGRGYVNPPKVTVWIDTAIYPEPTRPAVLEAIMQFDTIMRIDVIDPGAGYAVTPEIRIAPSDIISFSSAEVQVTTNTIRIYSTTSLQTGDLVEYYDSANAEQIGGLDTHQYYYVGVLDVSPTLIVALYTSYANAVHDVQRVVMTTSGAGNHYLQVGGLASCITSALPVRENTTTLRFDRTAYSSKVTEWIPGSFYSAFYAGLYNNSNSIASSAILLESSRPPISEILASAQGAAFTLLDVAPIDTISWSSTSRLVVSTLYSSTHGIIEIKPKPTGAADFGTVGPTLGFYVDMPIKFLGATIGGILVDTVYYILAVLSETQFVMSDTIGGSPIMLTTATTSSVDLVCYAGSRTIGTVVTIDYPGISAVTRTNGTTNTVTVPLTGTGQNGTAGYYIGLPVAFTGAVLVAGTFIVGNTYKILTIGTTDFMTFGASANIPGTEFIATNVGSGSGTVSSIFGGLIENDPYYITTVVDNQTITISRSPTPIVVTVSSIQPQITALVSSTTSGSNLIQCNVSDGLSVGDPIIFTGTVCGGLTADVIYFIKTIDNTLHRITICELPDLVTTKTLTTATPSGVLTANVKCVIVCDSTLSLRVNDPVIFNNMYLAAAPVTSFGGIVSGVRYFVSEVFLGNTSFAISAVTNGGNVPLSIVTPSIPLSPITTCQLTSQTEVESLTTGIGSMIITVGLPISPGQINGQRFTLYQSSEELVDKTGTTNNLVIRTVASALGAVIVTDTTAGTNLVTIRAGTHELTINDQITLTGTTIGNLVAGTYYIKAFTSYNTFTVSASRSLGIAGAVFIQTTASGSMTLTDVDNPVTALNRLSLTALSGGLLNVYYNMPFQLSADYGTLLAAHTYFVAGTGQVTATVTNTSSSGDILTCDSTTGFYPGMLIIFTGPILGGLEYGLEYYVLDVVSPTQFTVAGAAEPGSPVIVLTTMNGSMTATGENYIQVGDIGPGNPPMSLDTTTGQVIATQYPTAVPMFSVSYVLGGYRVMISPVAPGEGYAIDNVIVILGSTIGGTTPTNNLTAKVSEINDIGEIVAVICSGVPNEFVSHYYLKVTTDTQAELYTDAQMTLPVDGYAIAATFPGIKSSQITDTNVSGDITVSTIAHFFVNDEVVFTGDVFGGVEVGKLYYITTLVGNIVTVSDNPGGASLALTTASGFCTMSKPGTYLLLPEPFYFDQNIVTYNNRVYQCVVSNNDAEFIFGKWLQLSSDSRKLNALDRIIGYYKPTINMPGLDLSQLVDGIIYPNSTYLGNAFAPEDSFPIDTMLQDQPFYPAEVDLIAITWDGTTYIAPSNTPKYSAVINSVAGSTWNIDKISSKPLGVTDILCVDSRYVLTTSNPATPVLVSSDGVTWTTNGEYTPFDSLPFADIQFDMTAISVMNKPLNSVAFGHGLFIAVGTNIVSSVDTYAWREAFTFYPNGLVNTLNGVAGITIPGFSGFVAVGKGQQYIYPEGGLTTTADINLLLLSNDGVSWNTPVGYTPLTEYGFNAVIAGDTRIVIVGDNGARYSSTSGSNWASTSSPGANFNDITFAAGRFIAIGDAGRIETSTDGISWVSRTSGTTENLSGITYNSVVGEYVTVGYNNTILKSPDGITWTSSSVMTTDAAIYDVQGDSFLSGYGPEELVPGVVSDNLTFTVTTRPGTNWDVQEYAHTGYTVVSIEITPT